MAFFFFSVLSSLSFAQTRIAFLQSFDKNGQPVEYEPGGRFTHTAIQFEELGDMWLNAYPNDDVAIISLSRLQTHGTITEIIEIPQTVRMTEAMPYMGLPFDYWYSWSNEAIYCSELIGKILNIPTMPMHFNKNFWPKNYWKLEGTPGLSPDALYEWAVQQRLSPVP
ncbi:MAG: hypothetical protein HUU57_15120 [Bdellovibrio sp.]|nr:hypothetical protein [Bdellovibrio sp.]